METAQLKNFATKARTTLLAEINARLSVVLAPYSDERNEVPTIVAQLEKAITAEGGGEKGRAAVADKVAYTWFNRIIALRFMDANGYTGIGVVSPQPGREGGQPEILAEAKLGRIDREVVSERTEKAVMKLLNQERRSKDHQGEAYGLLLAAYCHYWQQTMPFMFEHEGDYTELLIPGRLLAGNSVMSRAVAVLTEEVCKDVEVIGWLYQFYISERKDEVFKGFKKNKKAGASEIPAATQLFTPDWIVRYLVENSLGRLWLLNRPTSRLAEQMEYYIEPVDEETDFLKIDSPEELKLIDPACGSGHILTYAFDLLYAIYEEEGYAPSEIPALILANNLYGTEIDPRAEALAAFALTMKARKKQRTFFNKKIKPNICALKPISFIPSELDLLATSGGDRAAEEAFWNQFQYADIFGALIQPNAKVCNRLRQHVEVTFDDNPDLVMQDILTRAKNVIKQAMVLASRYAVVVANPPYMGRKNFDDRMVDFAKSNYPHSKPDLYAMFIERAIRLSLDAGTVGLITMQSWMYLSRFRELRSKVINERTVVSLAHLGSGAFDTIGGEIVSTAAFVLQTSHSETSGIFIDLTPFSGEKNQAKVASESAAGRRDEIIYVRKPSWFSAIEGQPFAYRASKRTIEIFRDTPAMSEISETRKGMATGWNEKFVREWWEVSYHRIGIGLDREQAQKSKFKWFPYANGGEPRKWYGNLTSVVNWEDDGSSLRNERNEEGRIRAVNLNLDYVFREGICWTSITSGGLSLRLLPKGTLFSSASNALFAKTENLRGILGILNSAASVELLSHLNPTINSNPGDIGRIPYLQHVEDVENHVERAIDISRRDHDSFEVSWDFRELEVLNEEPEASTLSCALDRIRDTWKKASIELLELERIIDNSVSEELGMSVEYSALQLTDITLSRNADFSLKRIEPNARVKTACANDVAELISYSVGCMFGRYSLDKQGLILANQGDTLQKYLSKVPSSSFVPDKDNVIPIVDGDWFEDDIVGRVREFLRVTFGEEHFEENLRFVTEALGVKDLRSYFLKSFYQDHWKRYKKRPVYWMFSSPDGSFNALIYMHRYTPSTVSTVLEYLRQYQAKLEASRQHHENLSFTASATREKAKAQKEAERLRKILVELDKYEHEVLYPLATEQIHIDLDDGVKANYPKFGAALKKIPGLEAKHE